MSDWGKIVFYYDYEAMHYSEPFRVKGLVSKSYCYPGVNGMILHAYNGVKYFMRRYDRMRIYHNYGLVDYFERGIGSVKAAYTALNEAFDIFFEEECVVPGSDAVSRIAEKWEQSEDRSKYEEEIETDLINCEGLWGWLYISFTGNKEKGYKLSYGYNFRNEIVDMQKAWDRFTEESKETPDESDKKALAFFKDNATIMSKEEFRSIEKLGAECVIEALRVAFPEKEIINFEDIDDDTPIDDTPLSVRPYNCLKRAGILTVGQLKQMSDEDLKKVKNLGKGNYEEIKEMLKALENPD